MTAPHPAAPTPPRIIPLVDLRGAAAPTARPQSARLDATTVAATTQDGATPLGSPLQDQLGRPLRDLRISVTDRCNFRCSYCMPKEVFGKDYHYLPHADLLTFEEITRIAQQAVALGVEKIRLTGGEPLLRKNIEVLIEQLAALRTPDGKAIDLTLTTNGALLAQKAQSLKNAGLQRVTVSLDGLDDAVFRRMNDVDFPVAKVLEGIAAAREAGLAPIKVNMVVKKSSNADEIVPMARHFQGSGIVLRFIEYMDVGTTNGWCMDEVLPSSEVIKRIHAELPLVPLPSSNPSETAQRWGYTNAQGVYDESLGEIGVISSVSHAFCSDCTRARLSTDGQLYLCLFAAQGHDLRGLLRQGASDAAVRQAIAQRIGSVWQQRNDRYSALRAATMSNPQDAAHSSTPRRVEMSYIGG